MAPAPSTLAARFRKRLTNRDVTSYTPTLDQQMKGFVMSDKLYDHGLSTDQVTACAITILQLPRTPTTFAEL